MLRSDEILEAVVYNPYLKDMFFAKKNEGAWLNNQKLQIEDKRLKESIVGYSNCPYDEEITDFTFAFGKKLYKKWLKNYQIQHKLFGFPNGEKLMVKWKNYLRPFLLDQKADGQKKNKIEIDFSSEEDLERLVEQLSRIAMEEGE